MKTFLELSEEAHLNTIAKIEYAIKREIGYGGDNIHFCAYEITDRIKAVLETSGFKLTVLTDEWYKISW
jgi:hypothetical protein